MDYLIQLVESFFNTVYNVPELIRLVGLIGLIVIVFARQPDGARNGVTSGRHTREMTTMATPFQGNAPGNATPLETQDATAVPVIRAIGLSDLHRALRLGWEDFKAVPSHAIILCAIYPVLGLVLARTVLGERLSWLQTAGVACAFIAVVLIVGSR